MSVAALSWAFGIDLPCAKKMVLVALADMSDQNGECWPSQSTLAKRCGLARETVNREIKALAKLGLIESTPRLHDTGAARSSLYKLRVGCDRGSQGGVTDDHRVCDPRSQGGVIDHHTLNRHLEPSLEPAVLTRARATPLVALDDLENRLREAAGQAVNTASPNLLDMSEPLRWLEQGCDLDSDVIPAIRAAAGKRAGRPVQSWRFFTGAVTEALARRTAPLPEVEILPPSRGPPDFISQRPRPKTKAERTLDVIAEFARRREAREAS
jgi:hypothetical protein